MNGNPGASGEADLRSAAAGGDADATLALGDHLLYEKKDLDEAQAVYERVEEGGDVRGALKLGALLEDFRKDEAAAEAAWRRADEAGSVNGAGNLGRLLRERGDLAGAEAAFRRCVERGSERAVGDWAWMLMQGPDPAPTDVAEAIALCCKAHDRFIWDEDPSGLVEVAFLDEMASRCDPAAIEAGTQKADEQGSASGAWHLAWHLKGTGRPAEAVVAFRRAAERGHEDAWMRGAGTYLEMGDRDAAEAMAREGDAAGAASSSGFLGAVLDERGAAEEALEAYGRGDSRGDGTSSFNLGVELVGRGDLAGAEAALQRAVERDVDKAENALAQVQRMRSG
jgi:tetratricopeptide (TPR) repeat protein